MRDLGIEYGLGMWLIVYGFGMGIYVGGILKHQPAAPLETTMGNMG